MTLGGIAGYGVPQHWAAFGEDPEHIPTAPVTQNTRDHTPQDVADQLDRLGDDIPQ